MPTKTFFLFSFVFLLKTLTGAAQAQPTKKKNCRLSPPVITVPDSICRSIPTLFTANPVPGTAIHWSVTSPKDSAVILGPVGDSTYIGFLTLPATVQAVRIATDGSGCASAPATKIVNQLRPNFTISGNDKPCHSTSARYTTDYTDGDDYEWQLADPMRGSVLSNGGPATEVLWNAVEQSEPALLYLRVFKCGLYYVQKFQVTVQGRPDITHIQTDTKTICPGQPVELKVALSEPLAAKSRFVWDWGDGPSQKQSEMPPLIDGTYRFTHNYLAMLPEGATQQVQVTPSISILDANGCVNAIQADAPTLTIHSLSDCGATNQPEAPESKPDLQYELSCNNRDRNYQVTLYGKGSAGDQKLSYYSPQGLLLAENTASVTYFQSPEETQTYLLVAAQKGKSSDTVRLRVTTPALPVVNMALTSPKLGCDKYTIFHFRRSGATEPGWRYRWEFGDAAYLESSQPEVSRVYDFGSGGMYWIKLTATDTLGCTDTATATVQVMDNALKYAGLMASPIDACAGEKVTLTYSPAMGSYPDSLTWYDGPRPIATTEGIASLTITAPGSYWAKGKNSYGCEVRTNKVLPALRQLPAVTISGRGTQKAGRSFTLQTQDYGPAYTYTWQGGAGNDTGARMTETLDKAGTFTYTVTLTETATGCARQSPPFTVKVTDAKAATGKRRYNRK